MAKHQARAADLPALPDDNDELDRPDAVAELFGEKHRDYGVRWLERDASGARRIPYTRPPGSRLCLYTRRALREYKAQGLIDVNT